MFKEGQKVLFTEESDHETGTEGLIVDVDLDDDEVPYLVEFTDEEGDRVTEWCHEDEVEADGEVIE